MRVQVAPVLGYAVVRDNDGTARPRCEYATCLSDALHVLVAPEPDAHAPNPPVMPTEQARSYKPKERKLSKLREIRQPVIGRERSCVIERDDVTEKLKTHVRIVKLAVYVAHVVYWLETTDVLV